MTPRRIGIAAVLVAFSALAQGPQGFSVRTLPLPVSGGLDLLPNGHAVLFDGTSVVEVDRSSGTMVATLFTPPTQVFGSFVRYDASRDVIFFGESSTGAIYAIPRNGAPPITAARLAFNFDCAIDANGLIVVSADPTFSGTNVLHALDPATGTLDPLVRILGASGPVVFDDRGDLHYVTQSSAFPPPPGASNVVAFDAARLLTALGPGELDPSEGRVVATGLDGGFRARFAADGTLFVTEGRRIHRIETDGTHAPFFEETVGTFLSYLAFERGTTVPFRAYAPSSGGRLLVSASDFVTPPLVHELEPVRPRLLQTPANPIPPGFVSYGLDSAPAHGFFFPLVSANRAPSEVLWNLPDPVFLALPPNDVLVLPAVALDGSGQGMISLSTGVATTGGLVLHWQGLVLDAQPSIVGSSNPLEAVLQ